MEVLKNVQLYSSIQHNTINFKMIYIADMKSSGAMILVVMNAILAIA